MIFSSRPGGVDGDTEDGRRSSVQGLGELMGTQRMAGDLQFKAWGS